MLARVKPLVGPSTSISVPQIWLGGGYIGGVDALSQRLHGRLEANPERGQSSLSAHDPTRNPCCADPRTTATASGAEETTACPAPARPPN